MRMNWNEIIKDLNAGTAGGIAGIITGHPLDTIKVHLQTQTLDNNSFKCIKKIIKNNGINGFYKGMLSPIISNAPINAIVFATYGQVSQVIQNINQTNKLTPIQNLLSGASAGFLQTIFSSPAELIKIQLQTNKKNINSIQYASELLKKYGIQKGLYRSWLWTTLRDVPSYSIYFYSYELFKSHLTQEKKEIETNWNLLISGGLAGTLSWTITHPIDVIKSCIQSQKINKWKSANIIIRQHLLSEGSLFFFKGFGITILRAFPVNAITFLVYEKCINLT